MTIRSKLLVLLLLMSLVPLAMMAGFSLETTRGLGRHVGEHGRDAMTERELRHLEEKLSDGVVIFRNHRTLLEHLIRDQAKHQCERDENEAPQRCRSNHENGNQKWRKSIKLKFDFERPGQKIDAAEFIENGIVRISHASQ